MPKDPVDILRTKFWYEGLCLRLKVTTAYALEQRIAPNAFRKNADNISTHGNKWMRFRHGRRTPNALTCAQADKVVPGSSGDLNHVLWRALGREPLANHAGKLLLQLLEKLRITSSGQHDLSVVDEGNRLFRKIEHRASTDALACLTILLRINYEQGHHDRVWSLARRILRMLLILGEIFEERKIALELFQIYRERIFSLAKWDGKKLLLDGYEFLGSVAILRKFTNHPDQKKERQLEEAEQLKLKRQVLDGQFGIELTVLLTAPIGPDSDVGPPTQESLLFWMQYVQVRDCYLDNGYFD